MRFSLVIACLLLLQACKGHKEPDVSGIKVNLAVERFEIPFFDMDTLHVNESLQQLSNRYHGFTQDFLFNILGTTPGSAMTEVPLFIRSYRSMADSARKKYADISSVTAQVRSGLQYVHYYFPSYKLPVKLITFIGPVNSFGNIITTDALAVGLQMYMGRDYPVYLSEQGQQLYPAFIARKFESQYIAVNCIKNIIDDMFPYTSAGTTLADQMVESGKRLYLLDHFMPSLPDTIKTGYTKQQLDDCLGNEQSIWSFFVQNDFLFSSDPNLTRDYMADGPNTAALGPSSPGNIGQFVGAQIVKKWMDKKGDVTLDQLMKTPAKQIFEEAKYKPR